MSIFHIYEYFSSFQAGIAYAISSFKCRKIETNNSEAQGLKRHFTNKGEECYEGSVCVWGGGGG